MEITMTSSRRLSLVVLFACCLGYSQISPTTPSTPEAGVATVYFYEYQLAGIKIGKLLLPVNCDGTKIAALEPNSSFAYSVSPGKHVLTSSDKRNAIELNAKPGDVYYVRLDLYQPGLLLVKGTLVLVLPEQGTAEIKKTHPLPAKYIASVH